MIQYKGYNKELWHAMFLSREMQTGSNLAVTEYVTHSFCLKSTMLAIHHFKQKLLMPSLTPQSASMKKKFLKTKTHS